MTGSVWKGYVDEGQGYRNWRIKLRNTEAKVMVKQLSDHKIVTANCMSRRGEWLFRCLCVESGQVKDEKQTKSHPNREWNIQVRGGFELCTAGEDELGKWTITMKIGQKRKRICGVQTYSTEHKLEVKEWCLRTAERKEVSKALKQAWLREPQAEMCSRSVIKDTLMDITATTNVDVCMTENVIK